MRRSIVRCPPRLTKRQHVSSKIFEPLHNVVLCQAAVVGVHGVPTTWLEIPDETEAELASAVLVALELGNGCIGSLGRVETDDASASGATAGFVLDFCLLDIANRAEQLDEILVASRPRQLEKKMGQQAQELRLDRKCSRCERR